MEPKPEAKRRVPRRLRIQAGLISAGIGFTGSFSIAGALQDKNFRVVDQPIGDDGGHRGGNKDDYPVGKR